MSAENDLMQKLMISKTDHGQNTIIWVEVKTHLWEINSTPMVESFQPVNATYNLPKRYFTGNTNIKTNYKHHQGHQQQIGYLTPNFLTKLKD